MTETPQPEQSTELPAPAAAELRDGEPIVGEPERPETPHPVDPNCRKPESIRDEIRAGWSRALRRG